MQKHFSPFYHSLSSNSTKTNVVAVHTGKDTAREIVDEGVDEADAFNFYILQKK
jgi:hypothetical protein